MYNCDTSFYIPSDNKSYLYVCLNSSKVNMNPMAPVFALIVFTYFVFALKSNLEKFSIYSNKFFHNFHLTESSHTCPSLRASGLARRLWQSLDSLHIKLQISIINLCLRICNSEVLVALPVLGSLHLFHQNHTYSSIFTHKELSYS